MSVYRKGRFWHYDFIIQGQRFYGSTGQETKRAAEAVERKKRLEAATGTREDAGQLTIDQAASKYWDEKSPTTKDKDHLQRRLTVMVSCVGKHKKLYEIDAPDVLEAIARRRAYKDQRRPPSPSTINRDLIDTTLRPLMNRARKAWKAKGLAEIDWASLRQREPEAEAREYSDAQVTAWKAALPPVERFFLHLLLRYGPRFGELYFHPDRFDADGPRLNLPGSSRKNNRDHVVPLQAEDAAIIAAMVGIARAAGADHIWLLPGDPPVEITYNQMHWRLRSAAKAAGLTMPRVIHGARHHTGMKTLRATGNLRLTQRLLGHATIQSTVRYAHATEADLRAALDGMHGQPPKADEA
jgi:hypothetical protein